MVERINKLCKQKEINIKTLEKELEFGNGTVRRWDNRTPSIEKVAQVAEYFNVSIDYLYGKTDNPNVQVARGDELINVLRDAGFDKMSMSEEFFKQMSPRELREIAKMALQAIDEQEKED